MSIRQLTQQLYKSKGQFSHKPLREFWPWSRARLTGPDLLFFWAVRSGYGFSGIVSLVPPLVALVLVVQNVRGSLIVPVESLEQQRVQFREMTFFKSVFVSISLFKLSWTTKVPERPMVRFLCESCFLCFGHNNNLYSSLMSLMSTEENWHLTHTHTHHSGTHEEVPRLVGCVHTHTHIYTDLYVPLWKTC